MWHDHATILGMGFIMVTVHVMFDSLVFLTDEEYNLLHPDATLCVQSEVEQPEIHLISLGSSSVEDQATLVGDRLSCILDLNTPVQTESGIQVSVVITITIEPGVYRAADNSRSSDNFRSKLLFVRANAH